MKVIDISGWQEGIDFKDVKDAGIEGVIIKIAEGTSKDSDFDTFLQGVKDAGLLWGVYLFAHAVDTETAQEEAQVVLDALLGEVPPLGVWYDVEAPEVLQCGYATDITSAFINVINAQNIACGVYASESTFENGVIDVGSLANYVPYWVAQYANSCSFADNFPNNKLQAWQYSQSGAIGNNNVDMDEWYD